MREFYETNINHVSEEHLMTLGNAHNIAQSTKDKMWNWIPVMWSHDLIYIQRDWKETHQTITNYLLAAFTTLFIGSNFWKMYTYHF